MAYCGRETVNRAQYGVLILAAVIVASITATRPDDMPVGRGEAIAVWAAVTVAMSILLTDVWRTALARRGVWRVVAVVGVATLSALFALTLGVIGRMLLLS